MDAGEIIIKTKLAIEQFEKDFDKFVQEAKKKGKQAGEILSTAFNKAVSFGKGLLGVVGKIGAGFIKAAISAGAITTILGAAGVGAISLAGAFKKVFEENEQLKANIQYLVFAVSKALEPAINSIANIIVKIINFLFQAVQYTAYLIKAWTGKDIFAGASTQAFAESMASADKSAKSTAKSAKEINKQLAGFDEMNVLSEPSGGGGGGAAGGASGGAMPSFDLSQGDIEPPKWMQWVLDNGETVRLLLEGIGAAILTVHFGLDLLQGLGIFLILDGAVKLVGDLTDYLNDPSWDKLGDIATDVGEIALGFSLLVGITSPLGLFLAVIGQGAMMIGGIIKQIDNIIKFIKEPSWDNFFKLIEGFPGTLGILGLVINTIVDTLLGGWDNVKKAFEEVGAWIDEKIIQPVLDAWEAIKDAWGKVKTWFDENVTQPVSNAFQEAWNKIVEIFTPVIEFFGSIFNTVVENIGIARDNIVKIAEFLWGKIKDIFGVVSTWVEEHILGPIKEKYDEFRTFFKEKFEKIKERVKELKDSIIEKFTEAKTKIEEVFSPIVDFFGRIWDKVKTKLSEFGAKVGEVVGGAFKNVINGVIGSVEWILNQPIKAINGLIGVINKIPGLELSKLNTFSLPRLAKGGVINMPGSGVMVGNAIAGERGAEGVIPLTDSQQMALLGEAIGRYVNINATMNNYMNGRLISRELQKIQNESNFAYNR